VSLLRMLRHNKELSLMKLSKLTGLSKSYLSDLELNRKKGSLPTMRLLADFYNYDYEALCKAQLAGKETQ